jgi:hypothetical protein
MEEVAELTRPAYPFFWEAKFLQHDHNCVVFYYVERLLKIKFQNHSLSFRMMTLVKVLVCPRYAVMYCPCFDKSFLCVNWRMTASSLLDMSFVISFRTELSNDIEKKGIEPTRRRGFVTRHLFNYLINFLY